MLWTNYQVCADHGRWWNIITFSSVMPRLEPGICESKSTNCHKLGSQTGKCIVTKYKVKCICLSLSENGLSKYVRSRFCDRLSVCTVSHCSSADTQCLLSYSNSSVWTESWGAHLHYCKTASMLFMIQPQSECYIGCQQVVCRKPSWS